MDLAAPAFRSASVNGASLTVTFSEQLGAAASLANSSFSVKKTPAGGPAETVALSADDAPVIDGAAVTLTLASAVASTDSSIEVSYRKPGSGSDNKLADSAGNEAASFADRAVTNVGISVAGTPRVTVPNVFRVPARLGVDLGSVRGTEGLGAARYQWIRVDADGASNGTYIPKCHFVVDTRPGPSYISANTEGETWHARDRARHSGKASASRR